MNKFTLKDLQILEALFPLVKVNFEKEWAELGLYDCVTMAYTQIDVTDYKIELRRCDEYYYIDIAKELKEKTFKLPHYGELHDDKVADLIDEAEEIVGEAILEKQKQIMQKAGKGIKNRGVLK